MTQPLENTILVRFPLHFPLADVAKVAEKHGYRMKWIQPADPARRHGREWAVITESQYRYPDRGEPEGPGEMDGGAKG